MLMESMSSSGESPSADPVVTFREIAQEILDTAENSCGVEALEGGLERALVVLRGNLKLRQQFEGELISMIDDPIKEGVVELVSFTMYELRWPAVEGAIRCRVSEPNGNASSLRLYEAMLDAFSDSWRDRDLYARFNQ